eukprot:scaffold7727_cov258-Pinguiococcus_pyrenoidosus.AAC.6
MEDGTGFLSDSQLQSQFDTLNNAFGPYIQFTAWERKDHLDDDLFSLGCNTNDQSRSSLPEVDARTKGLSSRLALFVPSIARLRAYQIQNSTREALNTYFLDCISHSLFGAALPR